MTRDRETLLSDGGVADGDDYRKLFEEFGIEAFDDLLDPSRA